MTDYTAAVVGAGVVGLAVAARLAERWPGRVLVLERHDGICREASSRNSEVVHAGIYYPRGSRKATTCVRGRALLLARCARLGIPARRCGKVIVATGEQQRAGLDELLARGEANGVGGLRIVSRRELAALEPGTEGVAALFSPESGIVDSHGYAASFEAEARNHGADVVFGAEVVGVEAAGGGYRLDVAGRDGEVARVRAARVVNAGGLGQERLSRLAGIDVDAAGLVQEPWVGRWFAIAARHRGRVRRLVYPVGRAEDPGLGVHGCLDVGGGLRLGPDSAPAQQTPDGGWDLRVTEGLGDTFFAAGSALFPWLERADLQPAMAGVRCKLRRPGGAFRDFVLAEESDRGLPGWVTLAGIESPGLTAAEALAEEVDAVLAD